MTDPDLDPYYSNLRNFVRMVANDYTNLLVLDAKGGLGKTHNVREVLRAEVDDDSHIIYRNGFTTPIELFKTLYLARFDECVVFFDDVTGISRNDKAMDMLKAATDTEGEENVVEYQTSRSIEHPYKPLSELPNTFTFRGSVILSFNETPDNPDFNALTDRGINYSLDFTYEERLEIISELAHSDEFSDLTIDEQHEVAEWIRGTTDPSYDVSLRTFDEVCSIYKYAKDTDANWEVMALDVLDMDVAKHTVLSLRETADLSVEEQIETFTAQTGYGRSKYYDILDELRDERGIGQ